MKNFIIVCLLVVIMALTAKVYNLTFSEAIRPIQEIEKGLLDKALKTYGKKRLCTSS